LSLPATVPLLPLGATINTVCRHRGKHPRFPKLSEVVKTGDTTYMGRSTILFTVKLLVQVKREGDVFVSRCPALDVYSQGDTADEAERNVVEAVQLFLESCYERGVLEQVLKDCGFHPDRNGRIEEDDGHVVEVPLPLLAANQGKGHAGAPAS